MGQYVDQFGQQNYSCYTPTVNSTNSYITAANAQTGQAQTTQSVNYSQIQDMPAINGHANPRPVTSSQHQPQSIPTYTNSVNANSMNSSEMHMTQSQQQIPSTVEKQVQVPAAPVVPVQVAPAAVVPTPVKSANIDLLSGIDFTMTNPTIDNIPTLTPVNAAKPAEESPKKILVPQSPVVTPIAPVKLNDDLADLDFNSLTVTSMPKPIKTEQEKPKRLENPFDDAAVLKQFHKEVESLEKFMETLTVKTLNGVTPLANKWKELQDLLVKDEAKRSVSVARLFPDKNRSIDCLPYDHARVQLPTATDNYINAVLVKDCGPVGFILTQTPMANTVIDYWEMIWTQQANVLACLHSANEVKF